MDSVVHGLGLCSVEGKQEGKSFRHLPAPPTALLANEPYSAEHLSLVLILI